MPKEHLEVLYSFSYGISLVEAQTSLHKFNVVTTKDEWNKVLSDYSGIVDNTP